MEIQNKWSEESIKKYIKKTFLIPRIPIYFGYKKRYKIKSFPFCTRIIPNNDPQIKVNDNELYIYVQDDRKSFIGFHCQYPHKERTISFIICINGIRNKKLDVYHRYITENDYLVFNAFQNFLSNFIVNKKSSSISIRIVYDLPPENIKLTLNRNNFKNTSEKNVLKIIGIEEIREVINYIMFSFLNEGYIKNRREFWNWFYKITSNITLFEKLLNNIGIDEGVGFYKMVNSNYLISLDKESSEENSKDAIKEISLIEKNKTISLFLTLLYTLIRGDKIFREKNFK